MKPDRHPADQSIAHEASDGLAAWLADRRISLLLASPSHDQLISVGSRSGRLSVRATRVDRPTALCEDGAGGFWVAGGFQLWRFVEVLRGEQHRRHDAMFVPKLAHTVSELDIRDLAMSSNGLVLANTTYSCLASPSAARSFEVRWQPTFVSSPLAEDRCHLSGVAVTDGVPAYVTVAARTDSALGWAKVPRNSGALLAVQEDQDRESERVVLEGLCLPHSPRLIDGAVWLCDSGHGTVVRVDGLSGESSVMAELPGFARGLAEVGDLVAVAASRAFDEPVPSLRVAERLLEQEEEARTVVAFLDPASGEMVHSIVFPEVDQIGAVMPLAASNPLLLGLHDELLQRTITVAHRGDVTFQVLAETSDQPVPAGTTASTEAGELDAALESEPKVWRGPTAKLLESHADLTFPKLEDRLRRTPLPDSLLACLIPGVKGPAALSLSALSSDGNGAEIVSFMVQEGLRRRGLGGRLLQETCAALSAEGVRVAGLSLRSTWHHAAAMERLTRRQGWPEPARRRFSVRLDTEQYMRLEGKVAVEPPAAPLELVDWCELSDAQLAGIRQRQELARASGAAWYPDALDPFQLEGEAEIAFGSALVREEAVVGWLVCHTVSADTVQYSALFVDPEFRSSSLATTLTRACQQRQLGQYEETRPEGPRYLSFLIDADNPQMVGWLEQRMMKWSPRLAELRWLEVELDTPAHSEAT